MVFEDSWVLSHEKVIVLDDTVKKDISEFNLNLEGICELLRSWAQMIHLE